MLWNDPATGVMRHADAGYDIALDCAREHQLNLPGILAANGHSHPTSDASCGCRNRTTFERLACKPARSLIRRRMPWKNGGGETIEIAVSPQDAWLETFDWRVSMARVESDGPFSAFPGIDRTLAVLEGEGIELDAGRAGAGACRGFAPYSFPGDVATASRLLGGPITDLNVMTRRGRLAHRVSVVDAVGATDFAGALADGVCSIASAGWLRSRTNTRRLSN